MSEGITELGTKVAEGKSVLDGASESGATDVDGASELMVKTAEGPSVLDGASETGISVAEGASEEIGTIVAEGTVDAGTAVAVGGDVCI